VSPDIYAVKHGDPGVVMASTSGGVFTAVSDYILDGGGVVFGAMLDDDLNPVYSCAETKAERDRFRGSKYVRCSADGLFENIKMFLGKDRKILFTGTPCTVSAVRKVFGDNGSLLCMDFICHGTPPAEYFKDYIAYAEKKYKKPIKYHYFRYKSDKVPWGHTEANVLSDGTVDCRSYVSQVYKELFYSENLILQPCCYSCRYANLQRQADLTMADFWGIEKVMPDFADKNGVSMLMVNSAKGREVFDVIKDSLIYRRFDTGRLAELKDFQKHIFEPNAPNPRYEEFIRDYSRIGFDGIVKKYFGGRVKVKYFLKNRCKAALIKLGLFGLVKRARGK